MKVKIKFTWLFLNVFLLASFTGTAQNFPDYNMVVYDSSVTGYYFMSLDKLGTDPPGYPPMQIIMNEKGEIVYYRPYNINSSNDFKLQPNGMMSYYRGNKFYLLDSTFVRVDSIVCVGYYTDGHDLQILDNGHYLLLGSKTVNMDLSSYNYFNNNGSPGSANAGVIGNIIQELDVNKNVVFEWHSHDHFEFDDVDEYWLDNPATVDWTHSNTVEPDEDGNILLSSRHFNEITKINRTTGNIIWRLGGKENQFIFLNEPYIFRGQHDIRRHANGNITLFDNAQHTIPHGARGIEYALDETTLTAELVWSYMLDSNIVSYATGNTHRVESSRTLINYGNRQLDSDVAFSFVDSLNNLISELIFSDSSASYRIFFYPTLPWSLNRPQLHCFPVGINYFIATTTPHNSYLWSNGATTPLVQITGPGTYHVYVPYGEGFIKSANYEVLSMINPCAATSLSESPLMDDGILIYPNPASSLITIWYPFPTHADEELKIFDIAGKNVFSDNLLHTGKYILNTEILEKGIYFLKIGIHTEKIVKN